MKEFRIFKVDGRIWDVPKPNSKFYLLNSTF